MPTVPVPGHLYVDEDGTTVHGEGVDAANHEMIRVWNEFMGQRWLYCSWGAQAHVWVFKF